MEFFSQMTNSFAKKVFAVGLAASTALMGLAPLAARAAVHTDGTNVLKADGTVGMISNNQFRPYTSAGAFLSYGFNSWSQVVTASAEDSALTAGAYIPPQDGKILCSDRGTDKGTCYLITGGQKAGFTTAAVFTGLGYKWTRASYADVSWMQSTTNIDNTTAAHRVGTLVVNGQTVSLVTPSGLLGISDMNTFNSWGYSLADVVPANSADTALPMSTAVMASRIPGQLNPTVLAGGNPNVISGNVSVSLSSDTPASGSVIVSQAVADLAHFTFTGTGTVTQVVLKRIGVSADSVLSNVYLYQGNNKLTDAGSVSNGTVTFTNSNGLFNVNGSVTISVRSDIDSAAATGQTVGMQLAGYTVANGTPATVAVSGNVMNIAANAGLDTVTLNSVTNVPGANVAAGTMSATLWSGSFTVSGSHKANLNYVAFRQIGSIPAGSIQNLKLYVNGNPVGNTVSTLDSSNTAIFDMYSNPVSIQTGAMNVELRGDVVKGSSYTFNFRLQTASDMVMVDSNFGVNIGVAGTFPAYPTTTTKVTEGSVSVQSDPSYNTTQVVKNASNVTLSQWTMKAYGEDVKVQTLGVVLNFKDSAGAATSTTASEGFNNLSLYVNGGMVGSSRNAVATSSTGVFATTTFGTTNLFTIPAGTTVTVAVKGDMVLDSVTKVGSVRADLVVPAASMQGLASYQTSPTNVATYTGTALSVVTSSATLAKNAAYGNQIVSANTTNQKVGSYVIQASNAEGVRVTSLTVGVGGTLGITNLANLYIKTPAGTTNPVNPQSSNNFSVDFTVAANQTATVDVFADITNQTGTATTTMVGSGTGTGSQSSVNLSSANGQTITVSNGTLTGITFATSTSPVAQFVVGGKTTQAFGTWNVKSTSSPITVTELGFAVDGTSVSNNDTPITGVQVGSVSQPVVGTTVTVTGLNLAVPAGYSGLNVPITVDYSPVGLNGITSGNTVRLTLNYIKYQSGSQFVTNNTVSVASPYMTLVSTKPTVALASSGSTLVGGTVKVARVTVSADAAGDLNLKNLPLSLTIGSGSSGTATFTGKVAIKDTNGNTITTTGGDVSSTSATTTVSFGGYQIPAGTSVAFDVYVTTTGAIGTGANLTLGLGTASLFTWDDVNGNIPNIAGTYIANYPSDTVSIHN
jgi:hypothetical protein